MQAPMTLALAGLSFMLTVIWGPPLLRILRRLKVGKAIRIDGPERHKQATRDRLARIDHRLGDHLLTPHRALATQSFNHITNR